MLHVHSPTWCRFTLFPSISFPNFWATLWKITYRKGREIFIGSADIIASKQFYLLSANQSANHFKASTSPPSPLGNPSANAQGVAWGLPVGRMIKFWIDSTWLFAKWHNSTSITKLLNWCVCCKNIHENINFCS